MVGFVFSSGILEFSVFSGIFRDPGNFEKIFQDPGYFGKIFRNPGNLDVIFREIREWDPPYPPLHYLYLQPYIQLNA